MFFNVYWRITHTYTPPTPFQIPRNSLLLRIGITPIYMDHGLMCKCDSRNMQSVLTNFDESRGVMSIIYQKKNVVDRMVC